MRKCLTSLFVNATDQEFKVVVVDNASTDGSVELLSKEFPQVFMIRNKKNLGFSKANNQGIRYALAKNAEYILLLNNDVEILHEKWLRSLVGVIESDSSIGIAGCKLLYPDGRIQHAGGVIKLKGAYNRGECQEDKGQYDRTEPVDYVTGAALLIKSDVIRKIGLLDEGFSPLYYEDADLCVRTRLYGYKVLYTADPTLIHHCGSSADGLGIQRKELYRRRGFVRFFLLNFRVIDILKVTLRFESAAFVACLIKRKRNARLPISLQSDPAGKLRLFLKVWQPSVINLRSIIAFRRRRFVFGVKLRL